MPQIIQSSFAKGELSPSLYGRVDTAAYFIGLASARNAIIHTYGGVGRRPGSTWVAPVADHTYAPRLEEFQFKTTDSYILEFGDLYLRFIRDDGHVLESFVCTPTAITQANPGVVTCAAHEFTNGMQVTFADIGGMTELNGNTYTVANATTDTFELSGTDTSAFTTFTSGGTATQDLTITGATQADPVVITVTGHGFSNNDEVFISGVGGMTELNGNRYYIANVTANTFELTDQVTGDDIDGTSFTAFTSGGTAPRIYEIETPYAIADVPDLNITQSADVMTIVHPSYEPRELTRTDHDKWTLTTVVVGPTQVEPTGLNVSIISGSGSDTYEYEVTAINSETGEESLTALNNTGATITGITQADPAVVTATSHPFSDGDEVKITSVVGMTEVNNRRFTVANSTANTFELEGEDSTDFTAYSSGGTAFWTRDDIASAGTTPNNTITWTAAAGASRYHIYRVENGLPNFIGETELTTFDDVNITGDSSLHPPKFRDPWPTGNDFPGAVSFFEQRRVFGGSDNNPDTSEYSQVGNQSNFNRSRPLQDDDAITATLNSRQVNRIRHYIPGNDLLVLTSGSEWRVNSGPDSAFTSNTIRQKQQSTWGSSKIPPVKVADQNIFITDDQTQVRSLTFSLQSDGYITANLNLLSAHLFDGKTIVDAAYIRTPESRLYFVMSDGTATAMSFEPEQEVIAWSRFDTDGEYEKVESLRGGGTFGEDSLYWVVKRTINGTTVRYIEVMRQSFFDDIQDAFFVDSGLTLDSPVTITDATEANPVVITAADHGFSDDDEVDISDIVWVDNESDEGIKTQPEQLNGGRFTVANATTNTFELTDVDGDNIDGSAFNAYVSGGKVRKAVDTIDGFEHLAGEDIVLLANGNVVSDVSVDANGSITLVDKASRVHGGLPYGTDIQTLNIEAPEGGTIQGRPKMIPKVTARFLKTRGGFWGPDSTDLTEFRQREDENYGEPTQLLTGDAEIHIPTHWNKNGQVFFHQRDPLPFTLLAVIPDVEVGEI